MQILHMFLNSVKLTAKVKFRVISLNPPESLTLVSVSFFFTNNLIISRAELDNTETLSEPQARPWKQSERSYPLYGTQISERVRWGRQLCLGDVLCARTVGGSRERDEEKNQD